LDANEKPIIIIIRINGEKNDINNAMLNGLSIIIGVEGALFIGGGGFKPDISIIISYYFLL
jgi:hypothetical protein